MSTPTSTAASFAASTTTTPAAPAPPFSTGDAAFDAQLERSLTAAMRGCADLGEVRAVATRIRAGDFDSWAREWRALADSVVADGDESLGHDDAVSARRCYLRAVEYYRQAFFFDRDDLTRHDLHADYRAHVAAFRAAMPLLSTPCLPMELEQDGVAVSGYLLRPAADDTPRPTVIAPAGYDSTAEGGYAEEAVTALEYGMNCLVFEGPGQGGVLYERGQTLRPDFETVLRSGARLGRRATRRRPGRPGPVRSQLRGLPRAAWRRGGAADRGADRRPRPVRLRRRPARPDGRRDLEAARAARPHPGVRPGRDARRPPAAQRLPVPHDHPRDHHADRLLPRAEPVLPRRGSPIGSPAPPWPSRRRATSPAPGRSTCSPGPSAARSRPTGSRSPKGPVGTAKGSASNASTASSTAG